MEIGPDDKYELYKAFHLWAAGASDLWNDQPWGLTILLRNAFAIVGPNEWVARGIMVCFAGLAIRAISSLCSLSKGLSSLTTVGYFWCFAPLCMILSFSVMAELPAISLLLVSLDWLKRWQTGRAGGPIYLILSATSAAMSLHVKLTALLGFPLMAILLLRKRIGKHEEEQKLGKSLSPGQSRAIHAEFEHCGAMLLWSGTFVVIWLLIWANSPRVPWGLVWVSHFRLNGMALAPIAEHYTLHISNVCNYPDQIIGAFTGIVLLCVMKRWCFLGTILLMAVMLISVHTHHVPYWNYYGLHFAVLSVMLSALGYSNLGRLQPKIGWAVFWWRLVILASTLWFGGRRLADYAGYLASVIDADRGTIVRVLKENAGTEGSVFTRRLLYAFDARLLLPPEVALLPRIRMWSGTLSERDIVSVCARHRPDVLLLGINDELRHPEWRSFVREEYREVYKSASGNLLVFVRSAEMRKSPTKQHEVAALRHDVNFGTRSGIP